MIIELYKKTDFCCYSSIKHTNLHMEDVIKMKKEKTVNVIEYISNRQEKFKTLYPDIKEKLDMVHARYIWCNHQ